MLSPPTAFSSEVVKVLSRYLPDIISRESVQLAKMRLAKATLEVEITTPSYLQGGWGSLTFQKEGELQIRCSKHWKLLHDLIRRLVRQSSRMASWPRSLARLQGETSANENEWHG